MKLVRSPLDEKALGIGCFQIEFEADSDFSGPFPKGLISIKIPSESFFRGTNQKLLKSGFYYCGSLLEVSVERAHLKSLELLNGLRVEKKNELQILSIAKRSFSFDRFHRDPHIAQDKADQRYVQWLEQLMQSDSVFTYWVGSEVAGFLGYEKDRVVLHALDARFQGKGYSKYLWSNAYQKIFDECGSKFNALRSSVYADHTAVLNLYADLGFHFQNPLLCYHKFNP